jgi:hypothetical protein
VATASSTSSPTTMASQDAFVRDACGRATPANLSSCISFGEFLAQTEGIAK